MVSSSKSKPQHISVVWLILDVIGMSMMSIGFAVMLGKLNPLPPSWRFGGEGVLIVIAGLLCMLPLFWKIRLAVRHVRDQDDALFQNLPPAAAEMLKKYSR